MKRIDLLPPEQRVKASRERGLLWAILILVAIVVALGLVYVWQNNQVTDKQAELDQITAETTTVQQQALALRPYSEIQTTRTAMTETAKGIYDSRVSWATILQEISLVIPENVRLQNLTGTVPANMLPGSAVPAAAGTPVAAATADITFTGTSYTHKDVAEFMTRLGLIPQLSNVQLASSTGAAAAATTDTTGTTGTPTVTFTVTASLRPYLTAPPATVIQGAAQ
jgi:Tfp pilus assembly protein PilN